MYVRIDTYVYVPIYVRQFIARATFIYIGVHANAKEQLFKHKNVYKHINKTFKTYTVHMHTNFLIFACMHC